MSLKNNYQIELEFDKIKDKLEEFAATDYGKQKIKALMPIISLAELLRAQRETESAKKIIVSAGNPQIPNVSDIRKLTEIASKDGILYPEQLEKVKSFSLSCKRLKSYLKKAEATGETLAFTGQEIDQLEEINLEINRCISGDDADSNASGDLAKIRRRIAETEQSIKAKLEDILKTKKSWLADSFVSMKSRHYTLP